MVKTLAQQLGELQKAAEALPGIQAEVKKIEASIAKLNLLLGGQKPAARRGRPPKAAAAKQTRKARKPKTMARVSLKEKVLAELAKGPRSTEQLKEVDGRAVPRSLDKWVSQGILKKGPRGLYARP